MRTMSKLIDRYSIGLKNSENKAKTEEKTHVSKLRIAREDFVGIYS
jgi:hypothetical protein